MLKVVLIAYVVLQAQKHPTYPAWNPAYVSNPPPQKKKIYVLDGFLTQLHALL